jgi:hypothetical protein
LFLKAWTHKIEIIQDRRRSLDCCPWSSPRLEEAEWGQVLPEGQEGSRPQTGEGVKEKLWGL